MTDYTELKARAQRGHSLMPVPPDIILALIAENERLRDNLVELQPLSEIARLREQLAEAHEALAAEEEAHDALAAAEAQLTEMRTVLYERNTLSRAALQRWAATIAVDDDSPPEIQEAMKLTRAALATTNREG